MNKGTKNKILLQESNTRILSEFRRLTFEKMSRPISERDSLRSQLRSRSKSRSKSHSKSRSKPRSRSRKSKNVEIRLVERKDQDVNICWKYSIICIMILITTMSIVSAFGFRFMQEYYKSGEEDCFMVPIENRIINHPLCAYLFYGPIIIAIVSMCWIQMFYLCGRGGYTLEQSFIDDRPWHIVFPALVFFIIFTILQIIYMATLQKSLKSHCDRTKDKDENCEKFYQKNMSDGSSYYVILMYSSTLGTVLWLLATAIMVLRVIRAPDFKAVVHEAPRKKPVPAIVHRISENSSNVKWIYMNREFQRSRSVHFK